MSNENAHCCVLVVEEAVLSTVAAAATRVAVGDHNPDDPFLDAHQVCQVVVRQGRDVAAVAIDPTD